MKRIYKTVLALAASLFITKTEAKISEVNNRVVRIRFALIQQVESKQNDKAENLITYLQAKHDLDSSINSSVAWINWNNWLKSTWNNWSKNSLPNWNNWLKSNWNNWMKF